MNEANNNPRDVALIGSGYWGKNLARNLYKLSSLKVIVDKSPETLERLLEQYPGIQTSDDFENILSDETIKKVVIATPAIMHYSQAKMALEAGKDVYVEKPLSLEVHQSEELVAIAKEKNAILMAGHILQYHPIVEKIKALIEDDTLGEILHINSNRMSLGKLRSEENVLWSFAPHDISMILSFMPNSPEAVSCSSSNFLQKGIADICQLFIDFGSNKSASITVSWISPFKEHKLTIIGKKGALVFDDTKEWEEKLCYYPQMILEKDEAFTLSKTEESYIKVSQAEPLERECQHFLDSCAKRSRPRTSGEEGLMGIRVLNAAQQSMDKKGDVVAISPPSFFAHPSACIDVGSEIGEGSKIWHFSHIMEGSVIGESCNIGQNVVVSGGVELGRQVKIQNNVSLYTGVECADYVFIGPSVVFTNIKNPRSEINQRSKYIKTFLEKGATVGANATIVCGITLGKYSFVGAGALVCKNVPDFALVVGNPARQVGWVNQAGEKLDLPLKLEGEETLEVKDAKGRYILSKETLKYEELEKKLQNNKASGSLESLSM
ncbi:Uncharacterized protein AB751O23_AO_00070 [Chlamydiales bacterium SCGC AB-751-O23]|jgi:UDP-2-acetamido-3-amino-2,3-dideoxy-glucuronate N-acetyltransferase|nr:Uncharacterized protein AB751O23_AO_00070 [Chlamydiales bacterium SCGC AB-751-O23]